jgi:hypothetical protein
MKLLCEIMTNMRVFLLRHSPWSQRWVIDCVIKLFRRWYAGSKDKRSHGRIVIFHRDSALPSYDAGKCYSSLFGPDVMVVRWFEWC